VLQTLERAPRPSAADRDDEPALLALARSGDQTAIAALYRGWEPEARKFARRLVPASDVDDVVAEAFSKVFGAMARGRGPTGRFAPYLMCAVRTTAWRLQRQGRAELDKARRMGEPAPAEAPVAFETDAALSRAFRSLSERHRTVIWWFEVEGRTPAEVGAELGLSDNAAAALGYRARRALRAAYAAS
jgi:RNA polymerase sigma factor (sigma-70 family)